MDLLSLADKKFIHQEYDEAISLYLDAIVLDSNLDIQKDILESIKKILKLSNLSIEKKYYKKIYDAFEKSESGHVKIELAKILDQRKISYEIKRKLIDLYLSEGEINKARVLYKNLIKDLEKKRVYPKIMSLVFEYERKLFKKINKEILVWVGTKTGNTKLILENLSLSSNGNIEIEIVNCYKLFLKDKEDQKRLLEIVSQLEIVDNKDVLKLALDSIVKNIGREYCYKILNNYSVKYNRPRMAKSLLPFIKNEELVKIAGGNQRKSVENKKRVETSEEIKLVRDIEILLMVGKKEKAKELIEKLKESFPESIHLNNYRNIKNSTTAGLIYEELRSRYNLEYGKKIEQADMKTNDINLLIGANDWNNAIRVLKKKIEHEKGETELLNYKYMICECYLMNDEYLECIRVVEDTLEKDQMSAEQIISFKYLFAEASFKAGYKEVALDTFEDIEQESPNYRLCKARINEIKKG